MRSIRSIAFVCLLLSLFSAFASCSNTSAQTTALGTYVISDAAAGELTLVDLDHAELSSLELGSSIIAHARDDERFYAMTSDGALHVLDRAMVHTSAHVTGPFVDEDPPPVITPANGRVFVLDLRRNEAHELTLSPLEPARLVTLRDTTASDALWMP